MPPLFPGVDGRQFEGRGEHHELIEGDERHEKVLLGDVAGQLPELALISRLPVHKQPASQSCRPAECQRVAL